MAPTRSRNPQWTRSVRDNWTAVGHGWTKWEAVLLHNLSPVNPYLISALRLKPGHRVLDFGCGLGEPALTMSAFVGDRGSILGIDLSRSMLQAARQRARAARASNVRFRLMDVTRLTGKEGRFDAITARYGIMFPEHPEEALATLRQRLKRGGRIALAVWGKPERNPYFEITRRVVVPLLDAPAPDPEHSPHALRFSRSGRLARLMRAAGFREVVQRGVEAPFVFTSAEQAAQLISETSGSLRTILSGVSKAKRSRVMGALRRELSAYSNGAGLRLPGHTWIVSATR